jgi:hypothetical protein
MSLNAITDSDRLLIIGPRDSGKSSLAFEIAYEKAVEGKNILFISIKGKMEAKFPHVIQCYGIESRKHHYFSPLVLSRIQMKYISNASELKLLCASIHGFTPRPDGIVVDDLTQLIDPLGLVSRQDHAFLGLVLQTTAFIKDALNFLDESCLDDSNTSTAPPSFPAEALQQSFDSVIGDPSVESMNAAARMTSLSQFQSQSQSRRGRSTLVITADCQEIPFIYTLLRTVDCVITLRRLSGAVASLNTANSSLSSSFVDPSRILGGATGMTVNSSSSFVGSEEHKACDLTDAMAVSSSHVPVPAILKEAPEYVTVTVRCKTNHSSGDRLMAVPNLLDRIVLQDGQLHLFSSTTL